PTQRAQVWRNDHPVAAHDGAIGDTTDRDLPVNGSGGDVERSGGAAVTDDKNRIACCRGERLERCITGDAPELAPRLHVEAGHPRAPVDHEGATARHYGRLDR